MSSDLLEQAMIDAAALKEAAMKNAENALIEKYSAEFNQTVQKLLEQEDLAAAGTDPAAAVPPPVDASAAPTDPAAATPDLAAGAVDPMAGGTLPAADKPDKAFSKVPGAFSGGDDDELITINFDQIKTTLNEMMGVDEGEMLGQSDVGDDALAAGSNDELDVDDSNGEPDVVVKIKGSKNDVVADEEEMELEEDLLGELTASDNQQEYEEGLELEEVSLSEDGEEMELELEEDVTTAGADMMKRAADLKKQAADAEAAANTAKAKAAADEEAQAAAAQDAMAAKDAQSAAQAGTKSMPSVAESIELSEEELEELAEELKVDIKVGNLSDGYMGSTETQKREQRAVELAAARDDKAAKEREEELAKMKDLMRENSQLKALNNDALEAVESLKEQIEKLNVLNAKLLYTNKALANVSLNERQKTNIVESLSKADSVLAAKTIYETVQNAVEGINKEKEAPQSLRETLNRAATPFVVKKSANNSISDLMADRMKALAGIKKLS